MKLTGPEWKETRAAFCEAFPSRSDMSRLLKDNFGQNIDEISGNVNLLDMVDEVIRWFLARDQLTDLVSAAFTERPYSAAIRKLAQKWGQIPVLPEPDHLERIVRQANSFLEPEIWYGKFRDVINRVCQVEVKTRAGNTYFGTGVLIAADIILTNYHVIENVAEPEKFQHEGADADPADVIIRFDNRKRASGYIQSGIEFRLKNDWLLASSPYDPRDLHGQLDWEHSTASGLDYALLRAENSPGEQNLPDGYTAETKRGWVALDQRIKNPIPGMGLIVVQHPQGEALKVGLDTDAVIGVNASENRIKHMVNTNKGSSGSPCFNMNWDLIAIHEAGISTAGAIKGYNVAIPISKIIDNLKENGTADSLGLFL